MPPEMLLQSLHQQLPGENHSTLIPVMSPASADMTVLERQMGRLQWRQQRLIQSQSRQVQQQPTLYFADAIASDTLLIPAPYSLPPHILQAAGLCGEQGMIGHGFSGGSAGAWPDVVTHYPFPCDSGPGEGVLGGTGGGALSRSTFGCPPLMSNVDVESRGRPTSPPASLLEHYASTGVSTTFSTDGARESSKKRKSTERSNTTHEVEDDDRAKKMIKAENTATPVDPKVESPASTVITTTTNYCKDSSNNNNNRDSSSGAPRPEKRKAAEQLPKTDYIHVRARRGQATDSHSLAERVRREKISDRMKLLQGLVPGCNKITGKAGMLDEIINYVQSLQRQVEFLSMKLAAVTPSLDFNLEALITKELSTLAGGCGIPPPDQMGLLPPELLGLSFLQLFDPLQQQAMASAAAAAAAAEECCSLPVPILVSSCCNSAQEALRGVAGAVPASAAPDSCSFPDPRNTLVHQRPSDQLTTSPGWEGELQSFYTGTMEGFEQGSPAAVPLAAVDAPVAPRSSR